MPFYPACRFPPRWFRVRLYEFEGKALFKRFGIPVPESHVIRAPEDLASVPDDFFPAMAKAQVLVGGRGKAGGIVKVADRAEAEREVTRLMGMRIRGYEVGAVLLEELVSVAKEVYLGVTIDRSKIPIIK